MMYIGIGAYVGTCSEPYNVEMEESGLSLYDRQSGFCDRYHLYCIEIDTLLGYLCRDGLESFGFGLSYLHLGTVPVLFVSFCLICHPYMSVILEQNVFILVIIEMQVKRTIRQIL